MAIAGQPDPRNLYLNAAFWPQGQAPDTGTSVIVPQGNTQFDPFQGTGWGDWLDAAGAGDPGGIKMAPLKGLKDPGFGTGTSPAQNASPGAVQNPAGALAGLQGANPAKMAMMKNQEQKAANFYPNATNFLYKPFGNY